MLNEIITQKTGLLSMLNEALAYLKQDVAGNAQIMGDIDAALEAFGVPKARNIRKLLQNGASDFDLDAFEKLYGEWFQTQIRIINADFLPDFHLKLYGVDRDFLNFYDILTKYSQEAIEQSVFDNLREIKNKNPDFYNQLTIGYRNWYFEDNWLDGFEGSNNSLITNRVRTLRDNADKLAWLYTQFLDVRSRESLNAIIINWLTFSMQAHDKVASFSDETVCEADIHPVYKNEVYVDCGAYVGDTALEYSNVYNTEYSHMHTYDISKATVEIMKKNTAHLPNLTCHLKGVGEFADTLSFAGIDAPHPGNKLSKDGGGTVSIPVVKLDDDINEEITFLKVDVEGLDKDALRGAASHIKNEHPKLVVDIYHKLADIVDVALLIHELDPTYRFYLRCNNSFTDRLYFATKYALYAI